LTLGLLLAAVADGQMRKWLGLMHPGPGGAVWVHGWCRRIVRALGIACDVDGPVPAAGSGMLAVVSNHMTYLDVLVYSAIRPFLMVSKTEVRGWPLIGWITAQAGTIYVERADVKGGQRQTRAEVNAKMAEAFRSGLPVLFYPEGTTTDGREILPFRRGLFNSVVYDRVPVKTAAMHWQLTKPNPGATVAEDVCFVGDAEFGPHLLGFLGLDGVKVKVRFSEETVKGEDRFALAANARETMVEIWEGLAKSSSEDRGSARDPYGDSGYAGMMPGSGSAARQQVAAMEGAEDLFDRPVDGLGSIYRQGGVRG
jgi:1-acyl-sn-glycerol-3-phosphate acyltransferase